MPSDKHPSVQYVIGPDGSRPTIDDLPAAGTDRWVARGKAEIAAAVRDGLISFEETCSRYKLTPAELSSRQELFDQHGLRGLRTKVIQRYRPRTSAPIVVVGSRAMTHLSDRAIADHGNDLRRAEEHIAEARRIVHTQKGRIIRLMDAGVDTSDAECTLRLLQSNLRRFEEHRDILKRT